MKQVMLFFILLVVVFALTTTASAYHFRTYEHTYYTRPDVAVFMSDYRWDYWDAPRYVTSSRTRYIEEVRYPRYVHNRRSGKVFYVSDDAYRERTIFYEPFIDRSCPRHLLLC